MSVTGKRKNPPSINCASGTGHNDGEKIHRAIKAQQRADLLSYRVKQRTPEEWREEYRKAMAGKRTAQPRVETQREDGEPEPRWVQQKLKL
jgi:hypothetical protein